MITRLPEVTREGTARLWVFYGQDYPSGGTPGHYSEVSITQPSEVCKHRPACVQDVDVSVIEK